MTAPQGRVLIVDDQYFIVQYLRVCVESFGFEVCGTAPSAQTAIETALDQKPDVILMDVRLNGDRDGVEAAIEIHRQHPCRIIFVTGSSEPSMMKRMQESPAHAILIKPVDVKELAHALLTP